MDTECLVAEPAPYVTGGALFRVACVKEPLLVTQFTKLLKATSLTIENKQASGLLPKGWC